MPVVRRLLVIVTAIITVNRTRSADSLGACTVDGKPAGSPQQASPPERISHGRGISDSRRISDDRRPAQDHRIELIAAGQHGAVSRAQLLAAGISGDAIDYRVKTRRLHPIHRGVYRVGPLSPPLQRIAAALLACGESAVVSHRSAAELWWQAASHGLQTRHGRQPARHGRQPAKHSRQQATRGRASIPPAPDALDISVPRDRPRRRVAVRVHRVRIRQDEITRLRGIAITTPARTMLDLAAELEQRERSKCSLEWCARAHRLRT